ncbi:MAG: diacylglycerol kinase [Bacteroidetes bacterium]|nr:MAG: diacylglycerol kinase [Bacteroidota bacterium]
MNTSIIAAVTENNVIGKNNDLPWSLPKDMKFFKEITLDHHVIMGRKNYLSIPDKYRPLPNRTNVIITRQEGFVAEDCIVAHSIVEAIAAAKERGEKEAFIIGGGEIFKQALTSNLVDRMYITRIHAEIDGDVFFPEIDSGVWKEVKREDCKADEKNEYDFSFLVYEKSQ